MALQINDVQEAALNLEPEQRAKLAALLIESLEAEEALDEKEIERLWVAEALERARQIDAGEVELMPAEEVLEDLRRRGR